MLLLAILSGFLLAPFVPAMYRALGDHVGKVLALLPLAIFGYLLTFVPTVAAGDVVVLKWEWIPELGISLSFFVDGLSLLFGLLISGIGVCVFLYAAGYLHGHRDVPRFYVAILMFMASMLGVVLSDNLIALFVFWELTSLSSYLLIGYYHEKAESRRNALQALIITGSGGLALLAGFILMGIASGTYELSAILSDGDFLRNHPYYLPILILVLAGAFTKSAQFPFHFWLPNAMAAPAPVSSYLHSATMVKAGIYLLARVHPGLGDTAVWTYTLVIFGSVTMLWSAWVAVQQTDLKKVLAYSTVCILGVLTMLLGVGTFLAIKAAVVLLLAHSLYKGALFMVAGAVDHESGERDVRKLGGLYKLMPLTAIAACIAALSNAGIAPMLGFVGKEYLYKAKLDLIDYQVVLTTVAVATNVLLVAVAAVAAYRPFFGKHLETPKKPHDPPWTMLVGPWLLASLGLLFGVSPIIERTLVGPTMTAILGAPELIVVDLKIWHGFTPALGLSVVTVTLGILAFVLIGYIRKLALPPAVCADAHYDRSLAAVLGLAGLSTRILQNGHLRYYITTIFVTMVALVGIVLLREFPAIDLSRIADVQIHEIGVALLILIGAGIAVVADSRLTAIISLGVCGLGVALCFLLFSAPDLAFTQILVETLTVILFVLAFYKLPRFATLSSKTARTRDIIVSLAVGATVTTLILITLSADHIHPISDYFNENSYTLAYGQNIVNVILVDFRAIDTLGEVVVIGIAALGIFAMLRLRLRNGKEDA